LHLIARGDDSSSAALSNHRRLQMMKIAAVVALAASAMGAKVNMVEVQPEFEASLLKFNWAITAQEMDARKAIYEDNVKYIDAHNALYAAGKSTFYMGVNEFSHLTHDEFKAQMVGPKITPRNQTNVKILANVAGKGPAAAVDWRTKGAVTPVKNQGQCGSCWSFSTTGSTEGRVQIATGKLTSLSEQQLMDCSTKEGDHSCQGGLMDYGFQYIIDNHGIDSEEDYPYKMRNEQCDKSKEKNVVATIGGFTDVQKNSDAQMQAALSEGPVSVAIEADQRAFQSYKGGVFSAMCGTKLDHGVLAVGYDTDYWIVKNSWGATWGQEGYIELSRTSGGSSGECGILMQPSYPKAGSAPPSPPGPSPPPPGPSPPPPGPSSGHYGDPKNGCASDEQSVQITGVQGDFCSPKCEGVLFKHCPSDVPDGATAKPECVLETQGSSKPTQCALICQPSENLADGSNAACPTNASCKPISGTGICTYDD